MHSNVLRRGSMALFGLLALALVAIAGLPAQQTTAEPEAGPALAADPTPTPGGQGHCEGSGCG